VRGNFDSLSWA